MELNKSYNVGQALMILLMDAFNYARPWESKGFVSDQEATSSNDAQSNQVVVPMINPMKSTKVGRNEPCPCESGKKYKKCCGR